MGTVTQLPTLEERCLAARDATCAEINRVVSAASRDANPFVATLALARCAADALAKPPLSARDRKMIRDGLIRALRAQR